ncbi:MAG: AAA family ATPase [Planctomycetaceae bacterium]|nr:AAA family ATPase [Planctomycetaceae bacterium]
MIASESTTHVEQYQDIFKRLAGAINEHLELKQDLDESKVRGIVDEAVAAARLPRPVEVHMPDGTVNTLSERTHRQFEQVLSLIGEGHSNIMLVGPAGTGKTTLVKHAAKALGRSFAFISLSAGVTETHIFGRMLPQSDGTWAYVESPFIRIYRNGGVFLFDEVDAADGNVMVSINAALANGVLCNPVNGEVIERHADCVIVAAANTYGRGGDMVYVGRNALDGATLDRFVLSKINVGYDTDLEADMATAVGSKGQALVDWVNRLRDRIADNRLRRIASTRLVEQGVKALSAGRTLEDVKSRFFQDWSADEKSKVGEEA